MVAQEPDLPTDFRQHNLTEYNSSLLSPVFSLDRNNPQSIALWTRWQWQSIDADPTTLFFNYTRKLSEPSAVGAGFFQNNTGVFVNTGGILNYAHKFYLNSATSITVGANLIGYQRELAESFNPIPDLDFPQFEERNSFIFQLAPAVRLQYYTFSFAIAMENIIDYNFTESEGASSTTGKIYTILASYDVPLALFTDASNTFLRPSIYYKRLPEFDNQFGFSGYYSHPNYWAQAGYNSFYGISVGAGGHFFDKFSLGALIEFGTSGEIKGEDPTIELITAFSFGKQEFKPKEEEEELPEESELEEIERKEEQERIAADIALREAERRQDSIVQSQKEIRDRQLRDQKAQDSIQKVNRRERRAREREMEQRRQDSIAAVREKEAVAMEVLRQEKRRKDSLVAVERARELAKEQERKAKQDSIDKAAKEAQLAKQTKAITPEKGEKYEEVQNEDGL